MPDFCHTHWFYSNMIDNSREERYHCLLQHLCSGIKDVGGEEIPKTFFCSPCLPCIPWLSQFSGADFGFSAQTSHFHFAWFTLHWSLCTASPWFISPCFLLQLKIYHLFVFNRNVKQVKENNCSYHAVIMLHMSHLWPRSHPGQGNHENTPNKNKDSKKKRFLHLFGAKMDLHISLLEMCICLFFLCENPWKPEHYSDLHFFGCLQPWIL